MMYFKVQDNAAVVDPVQCRTHRYAFIKVKGHNGTFVHDLNYLFTARGCLFLDIGQLI